MQSRPGYVDASAYPGGKWFSAENYKLNWGLKTTSSPAILPQRFRLLPLKKRAQITVSSSVAYQLV
ncbi:hypothetical protein N7494_013267 [Penicillium frequentans]|uniref:Uncharacterized protein n=1 Tax=Penicillium frequentans TaxID=3151616 RepID=A0AAD6CHC2_9EURO|nr:hypothetical protein N7494_013287 [Penicillium glabrum]KAJ5522880.1 hypothetical protein N7494_013310 [Penicillium glabrum]KAJ5522953.1 hypothetical protein N7494_013267 [Penicillium glabrum]